MPRLDLPYEEDVRAETDMNIVMTGDGSFVEVQGTAEGAAFDRAELDALLELAEKGCADLTRLQAEALGAWLSASSSPRATPRSSRRCERILREHLPDIEVLGLDDVAAYDEPVEDQPTFEGNALLKARAGLAATGLPSLADDSGLCVDALNGMPGVLSARWSGPPKDDERNNELLLAQLADVPDERRGGAFRCAVAFCHPERRGVVVERRDARAADPRAAGERRVRLRRAVRAPRTRPGPDHGRAAARGEGRDLPPRQGAAARSRPDRGAG